MKFFWYLLFLVNAQLSLASINYEVGQRDFKFIDKSRKRELSPHVWYPTTVKANPDDPELRELCLNKKQKIVTVSLSPKRALNNTGT